MTTRERLFLVLAEELNFGRAAKKSYLSQQCFSDHIKRLEEDYGTKLFTRRPTVALTEAGRAVHHTLMNIKILEQGLEKELNAIENGEAGVLRIGMGNTRAHIFAPPLLAEYRERFPNVNIEIHLGDTYHLQQDLKQGKLDFILGINPIEEPPLKTLTIAEESLFFEASDRYLRRYLGIDPQTITNLITPVDVHALHGLPFVLYHKESNTTAIINQLLASRGIAVNPILYMSDNHITEQICHSGTAASLCSQVFVPTVLNRNKLVPPDEVIYILRIEELKDCLNFQIVYNSAIHLPRYTLEAFNTIKRISKERLSKTEINQLQEK